MIKKGGISILGAYLLGKRTNSLPQGGLVRTSAMQPTENHIRLFPEYTTLFGAPSISKHDHEFGDGDRQRALHFDGNWDGLEGVDPPWEGNQAYWHLHF